MESNPQLFHWLSAILFSGLVIAITVMICYHRNRLRKLENEKKIKELELTKAKLEYENDKKLMDDFAQRILDKNKLITDLEQKIKSAPGFNSSTESAKKSLEELSKLKILTAEDWDKFQMNYNKVFPGSIKKIITAFSELTESELRMFLLIKLGIRIREVASVLGISQESVRKTRYRLRKKLNMDEDADLDEFVINFSVSDEPIVKVF